MSYPALLTAKQTAHLCGFGEGRLYLVRAADPTFPDPVQIPGRIELRYRKRDVMRWIASLQEVPLDRPAGTVSPAELFGREVRGQRIRPRGGTAGRERRRGSPREGGERARGEGGEVESRPDRPAEDEAGERRTS